MKAYIGKEYLQIYLDYLEVCGADVQSSRWMANYGHNLNNSEGFVSFFLIRDLRKEFKAITDDPMFPFNLGYYLGENLNTYLEYTLKSCSNVEEIADLSTKFHFIRSNVLTPKFKFVDGQIEFEIYNEFEENEYWLPMLFATAASTYGFFQTIYGPGHGHLFKLLITEPEPKYFSQIKDQVPFEIRFNSLRNCLLMDSSCLELINPAGDPRLKSLLLENVKQQSSHISQAQEYRYKVRTLLEESAPQYPSMEQAAERLNLSKRTLARRLQGENTTYLKLLDEIRLEQAQRYLDQGLSVNEVSHALGYESTASFINLFKKHTGKTPSEFRKQ